MTNGVLPGSESISSGFGRGYRFSQDDERDIRWTSEVYPAPIRRERVRPVEGQAPIGAAWLTRITGSSLQRVVDLRDLCSPVRNQGFLDSCTAFAIVALREFLMIRNGQPFVELSPRYMWYVGREQAGNQRENTGLRPRDALHVLLHNGCSPERFDPYPPAASLRMADDKLREFGGTDAGMSLPDFVARYRSAWAHATRVERLTELASREPTLDAIYAARTYRISGYHRVFLDTQAEKAFNAYNDHGPSGNEQRTQPRFELSKDDLSPEDNLRALNDTKDCLDRGYGVIMAGAVYPEFLSPVVEQTGLLPDVTDTMLQYPVSSHCLFVAGYIELSDRDGGHGGGYLICKNSLGRSWGDRGYCYLPFSYFTKRGALLEVWTAQT